MIYHTVQVHKKDYCPGWFVLVDRGYVTPQCFDQDDVQQPINGRESPKD